MYIYQIGGSIRRDTPWAIGIYYWAHFYVIAGFIANFLLLILKKRLWYIIIICIHAIIAFPVWDDRHPYHGFLIFCIALLWIFMGWLLTYLARTKLVNYEKAMYDPH
jgi:small-conductance mechanosensitive channel